MSLTYSEIQQENRRALEHDFEVKAAKNLPPEVRALAKQALGAALAPEVFVAAWDGLPVGLEAFEVGQAALGRLRPQTAALLLLYFGCGQGRAFLADALGIAPTRISKRLRYARRSLFESVCAVIMARV